VVSPLYSGDLESLEQRLARAPPVSARFVEFRVSHLLKHPLRSTGTLEFRADGTLVRDVLLPTPEHSEASAESVRLVRPGKPARTLALQRAPQLAALLGSIRGLLEGKLAPLRADFDLAVTTDVARWSLVLTPRTAKLARYLTRIEVYGEGDRPLCLRALEPDDDATITLFDPVDVETLAGIARDALERRCRGAASVSGTKP